MDFVGRIYSLMRSWPHQLRHHLQILYTVLYTAPKLKKRLLPFITVLGLKFIKPYERMVFSITLIYGLKIGTLTSLLAGAYSPGVYFVR